MNFIVSCYVLFIFFHYTNANCYFPGELQGVWATQAAPDVTDAPIGYSMVTIEADEISTWGKCHTKVDNNLILAGHRPSGNGIACFRCFRLVVASVNVVALVSGGLESCYSSLQDALHSCPTTERGAAHIVLYKVRSSAGGTGVQETQCPFSGIFYFTYSQGDKRAGDRGKIECEQPTSELSNCPFGFRLSLEYRDCTFKDPRAADWHCLGSWEGLGGQKYIAVLDTYAKEGGTKPKYKCGIYKEDRNDGKVFLAFSRDSTCTNDLLNAENGYERYILYGASTSPLPDSIRDHSCRFPSNLRGQWHNTKIDKSSITYKDEKTFDTYHLQCVHAIGDSERYAIFSRTDCGKWFYNCIMIKRRSANIIEIMFGQHRAESYHPDICNKGYFKNSSSWITQAKSNLELPVTCPIVGTYSGELPDSPGYCAQLHSDCGSKDLMRYNIESCQTSNEVYEQREYQCIGQWEEDGYMYALTLRRDIHRYECFVGIIERKGVVLMKEAGGSSCKRGIQPHDFGMKVLVKAECAERKRPTLQNDAAVNDRNSRRPRTQWASSATRPWKPITGRPKRRRNSSASLKQDKLMLLGSVLLLFLVCRL